MPGGGAILAMPGMMRQSAAPPGTWELYLGISFNNLANKQAVTWVEDKDVYANVDVGDGLIALTTKDTLRTVNYDTDTNLRNHSDLTGMYSDVRFHYTLYGDVGGNVPQGWRVNLPAGDYLMRMGFVYFGPGGSWQHFHQVFDGFNYNSEIIPEYRGPVPQSGEVTDMDGTVYASDAAWLAADIATVGQAITITDRGGDTGVSVKIYPDGKNNINQWTPLAYAQFWTQP